MNLVNLLLINIGVFSIMLMTMLFVLAVKPNKKHSKRKVKEDLNSIKKQINGDA